MLWSSTRKIDRFYLDIRIGSLHHWLLSCLELKRALTDPGSSFNIMLLFTLEVAGISLDHIIEQPIKMSGFRGNASFVLGIIINLLLTMGPIWAGTRFYVIDACTTYHLLLGRPLIDNVSIPFGRTRRGTWMHLTICFREMKFTFLSQPSSTSRQKMEKLLLLDLEGVPLPKWEGLEEQKPESDEKASTFTEPRRPSKQMKFIERKRSH